MSEPQPARLEDRRPLSPHLQIYKPTLTMTMSIVHRITGGALYVGTLLLAYYFISAASGPRAFAQASWFLSSFLGQLILFGFTWALIHHMLGGVRHAIWDAGHGMDPIGRETLAKATLIGAVVLTVLIWIVSFYAR
jgi:succinate dehydrogenase / fumarate reductase cytochrome b subunit